MVRTLPASVQLGRPLTGQLDLDNPHTETFSQLILDYIKLIKVNEMGLEQWLLSQRTWV